MFQSENQVEEICWFQYWKKRQAKNEFEKELLKLMNNTVFGKTMEKVKNRIVSNLQITSLMP